MYAQPAAWCAVAACMVLVAERQLQQSLLLGYRRVQRQLLPPAGLPVFSLCEASSLRCS